MSARMPDEILGVPVEWKEWKEGARHLNAWGWTPRAHVSVHPDHRFHSGKFRYEDGWFKACIVYHATGGDRAGQSYQAVPIDGWGRTPKGAIASLRRNVASLRKCMATE